MKKNYFLLLAAASLVCSCDNLMDDGLTPSNGSDNQEVSFTGSYSNEDGTRLGIETNGSTVKFTWEDGDVVNIYATPNYTEGANSSKPVKYVATPDADDASKCVFTPQEAGTGIQYTEDATNHKFYAEFAPTKKSTTSANNRATTLVQIQTQPAANDNSNLKNYLVMHAQPVLKEEGDNSAVGFKFYNIFSVLEFKVKLADGAKTIENMTLVSEEGFFAFAAQRYNMDSEVFSNDCTIEPCAIDAKWPNYKRVTLKFGEKPTLSATEQSFYFVVKPGSHPTGSLTLQMQATDGSMLFYTLNADKEMSFKSNKWYKKSISLNSADFVKTANCVIANQKSSVSIPKRYANITNAELAWQDKANAVTAVAVNGNNIEVTTNASGNAVILGKNAAGDVLWSWTIWITNYNPNATDGNVTMDGVTFMLRNLGAHSVGTTSANAAGNYYQWGRKDAFPRLQNFEDKVAPIMYDINGNLLASAIDADGNDCSNRASAEKIKNINTAVGAGYSIEATYANPTTYCYDSTIKAWWGDNVNTSYAKDYWGGESNIKSINDPCPYGWKVPAYDGDKNPFAFVTAENVTWVAYGAKFKDSANNEITLYPTGHTFVSTGLVGGFKSKQYGRYWIANFDEMNGDIPMPCQAGFYVKGWSKDENNVYQPNAEQEFSTTKLTKSVQSYAANGACIRCVRDTAVANSDL